MRKWAKQQKTAKEGSQAFVSYLFFIAIAGRTIYTFTSSEKGYYRAIDS